MSIPAYKKNWRVCSGCMCENQYLILPPATCFLKESACLCIYNKDACIVPSNKPKVCVVCLPGLVVYPKVACCPTYEALYKEGDQEIYNNLSERDKGIRVCDGTCCGPLMAHTVGCGAPTGLCDHEQQFLCMGSDQALPCLDTVPKTFGHCGLMCSPGVKCCPVLVDLIGEDKFLSAEGDNIKANMDEGSAEAPEQAMMEEGATEASPEGAAEASPQESTEKTEEDKTEDNAKEGAAPGEEPQTPAKQPEVEAEEGGWFGSLFGSSPPKEKE